MSDLALLLAQSEGRTLEFKRDLSSLRSVLTTLVAFANTAGGTLIIGREDGGRLCGIPDIKGRRNGSPMPLPTAFIRRCCPTWRRPGPRVPICWWSGSLVGLALST